MYKRILFLINSQVSQKVHTTIRESKVNFIKKKQKIYT